MPTVPSFAKINLGLEVLGPRADGYTEIRTIFQSIDLADALEFEPADARAGEIAFTSDDPSLPADERNLVVAAATVLQVATGSHHGARIHLRKTIPSGGGLGGGSSNAAVTLLALRRLWGLRLEDAALQTLAASLGADVPYFLYGGTMLGLGRGEEVYPLPDASEAEVVVAVPPFRVSTAEAYGRARGLLTPRAGARTIWRFSPDFASASRGYSFTINELEAAVGTGSGLVARLRARLVDTGAVAACLSGSGSAVFGLFAQAEQADRAAAAIRREFEDTAALRCRTLDRATYRERVLETIARDF